MDNKMPHVFKMKSGEVLIVTVTEFKDGFAFVENPIAVVAVPVMQNEIAGETFLLKPWIGISANTSYTIPMSEVLLTCGLKLSLVEQYKKYVTNPHAIEAPEPEEDVEEFARLQTALLKSRNLLN